MIKVLDRLINKGDVLSIIQGFTDLYEEDDNEYKVLDSLYNVVDNLACINVVEAGEINIICENPYQMSQYLEGRKNG